MINQYHSVVLPRNMTIFLDTCAFSLGDRESFRKFRVDTAEYLMEEAIKTAGLNTQISKLHNWVTIPEVLKEIKSGITLKQAKTNRWTKKYERKVISNWIRQRKDTLEILSNQELLYDKNLPSTILEQRNELIGYVKEKFQEKRGKTNYLGTDIKLITLALIYAKDGNTAIYSNDFPLLETSACCAKDLGLEENLFAISDYIGKISSAKRFMDFMYYKRDKSIYNMNRNKEAPTGLLILTQEL